jgi:hypothetical protein
MPTKNPTATLRFNRGDIIPVRRKIILDVVRFSRLKMAAASINERDK